MRKCLESESNCEVEIDRTHITKAHKLMMLIYSNIIIIHSPIYRGTTAKLREDPSNWAKWVHDEDLEPVGFKIPLNPSK